MNHLLVALAAVLCWPVGYLVDALVCLTMGVGTLPGMLLYRSRGQKPRDPVSFVAILLPQLAISVGFVVLLSWGVRWLAAHLIIATLIQVYFWVVAYIIALGPIRETNKAARAEVAEGVDQSLLLGTLALNWLVTNACFAIVAFWPSALPIWMVPASLQFVESSNLTGGIVQVGKRTQHNSRDVQNNELRPLILSDPLSCPHGVTSSRGREKIDGKKCFTDRYEDGITAMKTGSLIASTAMVVRPARVLPTR
jgi:predicted permease